jgi:hypothetical protein
VLFRIRHGISDRGDSRVVTNSKENVGNVQENREFKILLGKILSLVNFEMMRSVSKQGKFRSLLF